MCVCVCVGGGGVSSHQSSIVYRGLNKLLIRADVQYRFSLLERNDRSEQMCLFFLSWTALFLPIAAIRTGSVDWERSRFMCGLHTHGCYCSCICATCAEYFSSLRLFTALWFPPPRSVSISSESALHSKQCEIDDCVVSGLVWEEQSVWQFMALSAVLGSLYNALLFPDHSLDSSEYLLFTISQHAYKYISIHHFLALSIRYNIILFCCRRHSASIIICHV